MKSLSEIKLAIIGLGYVGLPLAVEFGRKRPAVGFDINQKRIDDLKSGHDFTLETEPDELQAAKHLSFTANLDDLRACNCFIVTVPTPIDEHKRPELTPLIKADPNGAYAAVIQKWISSMIKGEPIFINVDSETSRDFCFIANAAQANLLDATTQNPDAENQVYNVAVGDRTTLNEFAQLHRNLLPGYPHLQNTQPVYRDFRAGDVRHSLADISKATALLGYASTQRIDQGLALAMPWYIGKRS